MESNESATGYRVLALETRPQNLDSLVGQENVRKVLGDIISKGRLPHALLLTGTRGTGKTSTARIFAKSLCCAQGPTIAPCGTCVHCVAITASAHEDVLEIDGASNTGVDQIRELRESARFYPKSARYKIFIIDEVHMLSIGAFNALLKTLEEPPPLVLFVLATTEVNKVPATVRSRCMILPFRKADIATLADHLTQVLKLRDVVADADALVLVAREARGSFRDALSLLEQALPYAENGHLSMQSISEAFGLRDREIARELFLAIAASDPQAGLSAIDQADQLGFDFGRIMQQVSELVRIGLIIKVCQSAPDSLAHLLEELLESERQEIIKSTEQLSKLALTETFRILQQCVQDMARSSAPRPWAEIAFLECIDRAQWMDTGSLLKILENTPAPAVHSSHSGQSSTHGRQAGHAKPPSPSIDARPVAPRPQVRNQPAEHAQSSVPKEPSATAADASNPDHPVDLVKLRQWIGLVSEKSVPLGAKLRHAQFEIFGDKLVRLAANHDNQLYGSISAGDMETLKGALRAVGYSHGRIDGFAVGGSAAATSSPKPSPKASNQTMDDQKKSLTPRPGAQRNETTKKHETPDPFLSDPNESRKWLENRNQPADKAGAASISQIDAAQAKLEFEKKRDRILAHPFLVKLGAATDGLTLTPTSEATEES
jgi:DNA polymerase-3 subunit gamma/tau